MGVLVGVGAITHGREIGSILTFHPEAQLGCVSH